jgi:hypothetical protein
MKPLTRLHSPIYRPITYQLMTLPAARITVENTIKVDAQRPLHGLVSIQARDILTRARL